MALVTLTDVLGPAAALGYAVPGLVVLGWEDAVANVRAAEAEQAPVILMAGPACRAHTPLPVLGAMFRSLAQQASVPVVAHLDHGYDLDICRAAVDAGFTSVMFDGSRLPLAENIAHTAEVAAFARSAGVSIEGELGVVGYHGGVCSQGTDPVEAERFERETGVDALAVSVGNVHLQTSRSARLNLDLLAAIEAVTRVPLVIHGTSGIPGPLRTRIATETRVCKFNVGTELRQAFGNALRQAVNRDLERFDRLEILKETIEPVQSAAAEVFVTMGATGRAKFSAENTG